jgi:squalene-hopene/tetraprenyl-beta-curcumene cyclase
MKMLAFVSVAVLGFAPQGDDLGKRLRETWTSAADWLVTQQDASGAWKMSAGGQQAPSPAYTGLIITSLANGPAELRGRYKEPLEKALAYLVSKANEDGSFGEGPTGTFMKTYTTGIALMALGSVDREKYARQIRGAQAYLKQNQMKEGVNRGGSGYGDDAPTVGKDGKPAVKKGIANISTTGFSAEGLHMSGLPKDDEFWKLVVEFVRRCQNSSEVNTDPAFLGQLKEQGLSVGDDGGLYYAPVADRALQKAGTKKVADKESIASYGAMTYDGIKTYLYAGLAKDSPEVRSAMDWVRKNYSVETHPGFAYDAVQRHHLRGLYHYLLVMSRALDAFGENPLETFDGKKHDWPREIAAVLVRNVKDSKMWINENAAWYEGDAVLVTSYVLTTCDVLLKHVK